MRKIFIAGFGGSGSRVPVMILEKSGYWIGDPYTTKDTKDYCGPKHFSKNNNI